MTTKRQSLQGLRDTRPQGEDENTSVVRANIPVSGVSVDGAKGKPEGSTGGKMLDKIGFNPEPNIMSSLYQPTYHFKFYLLHDLYPDPAVSVTIAETGLTGLNIQDVRIESFVGPNMRTRNTTATSMTIKIYEPMGAQLPDVMLAAAQRMRISNYLKAPWYLDLRLRGYDEAGNQVEVDGSPWRWKLILLDIQSQISESGAMHTISAIPMAEVALNNQYGRLPKAMSIKGETVGEALQAIIKSMNEDSANRYGEPYYIKYEIEDIEYSEPEKVSRPFQHRIVSDAPQQHDERNSGVAQFSPGTDIPSIVDALIASSTTGVEQARHSRSIEPDPPGEDREGSDVKSVVSVMHRVDTKVEHVGYHPILGDYRKVIKFVVRPYSTLRLFTSVGRAVEFDKSIDLQRQKANFAKDKLFLVKQYDYVFTGMNTEVEKFDINVNFRWAVSVPMLKGRIHYGSETVPREINEDIWLRDTQMELSQIQDRLNKIDSDHQGKQLPEETQDERESLVSRQNTLRAEFNARNAAAIKAYEEKQKAARKSVPKKYMIAEDENLQQIDTSEISSLPITVVQDPDDPSVQANFGVASQAHAGKSVYGALLNQLYGSFDGNLQNIQLDIKGDPYWLGPSTDVDISKEPSTRTKPNFMNGEHMFVFRFKLPMGYDQNTGAVHVASENGELQGNTNIVTGFYATTRVVHQFSNGIFKQTLEATRVPGWSIEKIIRNPEQEGESPEPGHSKPSSEIS